MSVTAPSRGKARGAVTPPHISSLILLAGSSVVVMNIFLPVLPQIGTSLGTTPAMTQYVLTLFLAATGVFQLIIGPIADRFGRRPVLFASTLVFLAATLLCIFATSIEMLLVGRVLQASIAASMSLSRAIIRDLYERSKAASMIGYVTMAMAVMPMIAPSIGGYVGEVYGWRGTFVVLFMLGSVNLALIWFDVGETHEAVHNPVSEQIADYISLLKEPLVWGYIACASLASGAYFAFLGGAPFVSDVLFGLSPAEMGLWFATVAIGYMFGNYLSGRFSERIGIERMMLFGGLIAGTGVALSLMLMSLLTPRPEYLYLPMVLVGCGNGMTLPNSNAGAISVRPDLSGSASGLAGFMQIGGGAALAALSGVLISEQNEGMPLYLIMFFSSVLSAALAYWMYRRAKRFSSTKRI